MVPAFTIDVAVAALGQDRKFMIGKLDSAGDQ
jgi:hypothetical protein